MKAKFTAILIGAIFIAVALLPVMQAAPPTGQGNSKNLSTQEAALLNSIDVEYAMDQLYTISSMGEKIAGDEAEWAAQQYVFDEFCSMPMDYVTIKSYPTTSWGHDGDTMKIVSPVMEEIRTTVYGYCYGVWGTWFGEDYAFGNSPDGKVLTAPVVYVGLGTKADFEKVGDLNGAIALIYRDDNIQMWPSVMNEEAALHGASATIAYGYYGGLVNPEGIKQDVVGGPLPYFSISQISALHILDLLAKGPVTLELSGMAYAEDEHVGLTADVAAYMIGSKYPDEYVVFSGHIDCWWNGTSDDTSSIAAVLEFARLFSDARENGMFDNERTLVFLSCGGEEFGGPNETWYDWLIGSYEFVMDHPEIMEGLVIELNMDGVSFKKASGQYWAENTWEINGLVAQAIKDIGKEGQIAYYNPIWSWTDAWSFGAKGGGSTIQCWWAAGYDPIYHTQLDDLNLMDPEPVTNVLELYTVMAVRTSNCIVMPIDFTYTINWVAGYLYSEKVTVPYEAAWFDRVSAALDDLRVAVTDVNAYASELNAEYKAAKSDGKRAIIRAQADALNAAIIDARRVITPWTLGEGGTAGSWDVFLRSDQHVHDLGLIDSAIASLMRDKGRINQALVALASVYSMEWGHLFSREVYESNLDSMISDQMYWGDDFDQQQAYVNVYPIYWGLAEKTMSPSDAVSALNVIKSSQLIPWLEEDLESLEWAYGEAAMILAAAVP